MYKEFFRLTEAPFSIAPDPRFLFMSERHREALAHLMYAIEGDGGIVLLTGEVGTGKTTVSRCLLDLLPDNCDVALILNPRLSATEMLATVCDEFHLIYPPGTVSIKVFTDALNTFLLSANAQGRKTLLIIDEAQNLAPEVLEQVRLLTNLETNTRKLLRIILIGQPELQELLGRPDLRQVEQRVVARYHLTHLTKPETIAYVGHRLHVSGAQSVLIPEKLFGPLYRAAGGVPRLVNVICDRALLGAYVQGKPQVDARIMRAAISESLGGKSKSRWRWGVALLAAGLAGLAIGLGTAFMPGNGIFGLGRTNPAITPDKPAASSQTKTETKPDAAAATPVSATNIPAILPLDQALAWPANVLPAQAETLAYRTLVGLHGSQYTAVGDLPPCQQVERFGLRCLDVKGDLDQLRHKLDLPVILKWTAADRSYPVVVSRIDGEQAAVVVGGETRLVSVADLSRHWKGGYVTLWRPPPGYTQPIGSTTRGPAIGWLREALASAQGRPPESGAEYDDRLASRVREFQTQEGINADGLAGPYTLVRLIRRLEPNGVRLVHAGGDR